MKKAVLVAFVMLASSLAHAELSGDCVSSLESLLESQEAVFVSYDEGHIDIPTANNELAKISQMARKVAAGVCESQEEALSYWESIGGM